MYLYTVHLKDSDPYWANLPNTAWVFEACKYVCYMQYVRGGQRATKLPVLFQSYLLQVMYMTFQYLTVSCIPHTGHVYDISIPDSFMHICYRLCI